MAMEWKAEIVLDARPEHGEGPAWDANTGTLVWVDIFAGAVHRYDPTTGADQTTLVGGQVGAAVPTRTGRLLLALETGFAMLDENGVTPVAAVPATTPGLRLNDAKADPAGRLWSGTMASDERTGVGTLYRLDADHGVTAVLSDLTIPNGMAWSLDGSTMFFIDSPRRTVDAFNFDLASGRLSDRRTFIDLTNCDGVPDGMTIDADGNLWIAMFGGSCVRCHSADGALRGFVRLPVTNVTSCTFGGADFGDLLITTSPALLGREERKSQPDAGAIFRCRPGVLGTPTALFDG